MLLAARQLLVSRVEWAGVSAARRAHLQSVGGGAARAAEGVCERAAGNESRRSSRHPARCAYGRFFNTLCSIR